MSRAMGLSPRGRGNPQTNNIARSCVRSIPAWAGKPPELRAPGAFRMVYPRVGGETTFISLRRLNAGGLSPRGRGNRSCRHGFYTARRSIPAWAGETSSARSTRVSEMGLSPRGRGNHHDHHAVCRPVGSIPAWAGKPLGERLEGQPAEVYPRVGGETSPGYLPVHQRIGLSPRGRGNLSDVRKTDSRNGSIPAWAGKPTQAAQLVETARVYPRVGGETVLSPDSGALVRGLSPRGRGNQMLTQRHDPSWRSIPAWAGKPNPRL